MMEPAGMSLVDPACDIGRGRGIVRILFAFLLLGGAAVAQAQDAATPGTDQGFETIEVVGLRDPERLSADDLRRAMAAFAQWRPTLAPAGVLSFAVTAKAPATDAPPLRVRVVDAAPADPTADPTDVVWIGPDRFSLPPLDYSRGTLALQANRRSGTLTMDIQVMSPGTDAGHRRIGDLRTQCRVWWAVLQPKVPFLVKAMLGVGGSPCTSTRFGYFLRAPRPIAAAALVTPQGRTPLKVLGDAIRYRPPLYDAGVADSATVELTFR